ncbi:MAG: phage tail assembly protein [Roseomonas sp.]|nr:phage tail assembly protein [Roseomonas sp.]
MQTIKLSQPIELRAKATGEVIDSLRELTLRPPNAGDMADALDEAGGDMKRVGSMTRFLACRCCGITPAQFNALPIADGIALITAAATFLPSGQETGPTH